MRVLTSCHNIQGLVALTMMSLRDVGAVQLHAGQGEKIMQQWPIDCRANGSKVTITKPHSVCKGHQ